MAADQITLDTVLSAQSELAAKKAKQAQYSKELVAAQKRADRLDLEVSAAEKLYDEVRKAFESKNGQPKK